MHVPLLHNVDMDKSSLPGPSDTLSHTTIMMTQIHTTSSTLLQNMLLCKLIILITWPERININS